MCARLQCILENTTEDSTQHIKGSYDQWHIHQKGLKDAINLRSGIGAFDKNKELRLTIMWVDLSGAYSQDIKPQFPFPYHLSQPKLRQDESSYSLQAQRSPLNRYCASLQVNLADLIGSVSQMDAELRLNSGPSGCTQHQHQYMPNGDWTNSIIHHLLSIPALRTSNLDGPSPDAFIDEARRLGLLLFLAEIRRRCGVQPTRTIVLTEKLAGHLRSRSITFQQRQRGPFLWLLVVGAMEAFPIHGSGGYLQNIRFMMDQLHIEGWGALVRILRGVLWSDEVYATRAEAVYMAITAMSK